MSFGARPPPFHHSSLNFNLLFDFINLLFEKRNKPITSSLFNLMNQPKQLNEFNLKELKELIVAAEIGLRPITHK